MCGILGVIYKTSLALLKVFKRETNVWHIVDLMTRGFIQMIKLLLPIVD
jgi:hypothetical protein